jgi:hypothetical protein
MSDSGENKPEPTKPEPLAYWTAKAQPPAPTIVVGLSFTGGLLTSMVGVFLLGAGGFCLFGNGIDAPPSHSPHQRLATGILAGLWIALTISCGIWAIRKVRDGRNLPLEWRREPKRLFVLGLLIGCGIAGLIEGLCFGAQTFSR